jgi:ent-kaurene oxidase
VELSNGMQLPRNSFVSIAYQPLMRDPEHYPDPLTFNPLRFYELRKAGGEEGKHQFASVEVNEPMRAFGKFACPGRHWATAQIKLSLMVLLLEFDIGFPLSQGERPGNKVYGGRCIPSATQKLVLKRRQSPIKCHQKRLA